MSEPRFLPKIGGGKPACLGTIEMADPVLTATAPGAAYADLDTAPQPLEIAPLLEAAQSLVVNSPPGRLAEVLRWPREDRECPDRSY